MHRHLVEIKARCPDLSAARDYLQSAGADFKGIDCQKDTYFRVERGRLKLRCGQIEQSLIYYERNNQAGPKESAVTLCRFETWPTGLEEVLSVALGPLQIVEKEREIHFLGNVKFHLDTVQGLGTFLEIEAIGYQAEEREVLLAQCQQYLVALGVAEQDLVAESYSDMMQQADA